jgi:NAD(P)-dependent dehydrogenase (short-subunit alcohol dehydrogenase family)
VPDAASAEHGKALIVTTASVAGKSPPWLAVYSATKAAYSPEPSTQKEVADRIGVTALAPGFGHPDDRVQKGQVPAEEMTDDRHRGGGAFR